MKFRLCDYSDVCILVNGTITISAAGADDDPKQAEKRNKEVIFKNCPPFTNYISEINNTQVDNLSVLIFWCIYFREVKKKIVFREYFILRMASF